MEIKYPLNNYTKEDAYHLIDGFLDSLVNQYSDMISNPEKEWNKQKDKMNFKFEAKGYEISGDIRLQEKELILNGKLPFVARLVSGKIERIINEKLDELFVKRSGESFG
jgi:hypothetical protein